MKQPEIFKRWREDFERVYTPDDFDMVTLVELREEVLKAIKKYKERKVRDEARLKARDELRAFFKEIDKISN